MPFSFNDMIEDIEARGYFKKNLASNETGEICELIEIKTLMGKTIGKSHKSDKLKSEALDLISDIFTCYEQTLYGCDAIVITGGNTGFRLIDEACKHWYIAYERAFSSEENHSEKCGGSDVCFYDFEDYNNLFPLKEHHCVIAYIGYGFRYSEIAKKLNEYTPEILRALLSKLPNASIDEKAIKSEVDMITNK